MRRPQSVLEMPFEATAHLTLERFGPQVRPGTIDMPIGGYIMIYVGQPGTGNMPGVEAAKEGQATMHESTAIGGAFRHRDKTELLNLAIYTLGMLHTAGVLDEAAFQFNRAIRAGRRFGESLTAPGDSQADGHR